MIGPEQLIEFVTPDRAHSIVELGVLSLMAHARTKRIPSEGLGRATFEGITNAQARLANDTRKLYSDAALAAIARSMQHAVENDMDMTNWKPQSEFFQRLERVEAELKAIAAERDATAAERDATAAERDATAAERDATVAQLDEAQAAARKALVQAREAVHSVLSARDLTADAQTLRTIERCDDLDQLHAWLTASITATTLQNVFGGDGETTH
ncbi:MAG: hypothetical protein ACJA1R_000944 [Flavobacteriales bacterium]